MSGEAIPPGAYQQELFLCEGLRLMNQNLATLAELRLRQDKLREDALLLQEEMKHFKVSPLIFCLITFVGYKMDLDRRLIILQDSIAKEVQLVLTKCPWTIRPPRVPPKQQAQGDPDTIDCELLPAPPPPWTIDKNKCVPQEGGSQETLDVAGATSAANIDSDYDQAAKLPPPLQPQVVPLPQELNKPSLSWPAPETENVVISRDPLSPTFEEATNLPSPLQPEVVSIFGNVRSSLQTS